MDYDSWNDEYRVRTPDGKEYRYTLEMLMDGYPRPHAYPTFPDAAYSAFSTGMVWGMPTSLQTKLVYSGYQPQPVPPSPTDSPNLKWLRGRVDEIRVPLENLS